MRAIADEPPGTSERYRTFGVTEARGTSDCYEEWALGVAADRRVIELIDELPRPKRQVNLVFASARFCGAPVGAYSAFRSWLVDNWPAVKRTAMTHATQTNEPARCAVLLPLLAALPQPLALIEVGASAGLCLFPDQYSYRYDGGEILDPPAGRSTVILDCATRGPVPIPERVPDVVSRAGIDLNPLDVRDPGDVAWLSALIWPEHDDRRARLKDAVRIAGKHPPAIVRGDLNHEIEALAGAVPDDVTPVIFHTAVLAYLDLAARERFAETVSGLRGHWISNEGVSVTPGIEGWLAPPVTETAEFLLALDGRPVAYTQPHGRHLEWLA